MTGIWKLFNKKHPFNCCSLVSQTVILKFNKDSTIDWLSSPNQANIFKATKRKYSLKNNRLTVFLDNKNFNIVQRFMLRRVISSKTFQLKKINSRCFQAVDIQHRGNNFVMCKVK